jgi:hypothetical protein
MLKAAAVANVFDGTSRHGSPNRQFTVSGGLANIWQDCSLSWSAIKETFVWCCWCSSNNRLAYASFWQRVSLLPISDQQTSTNVSSWYYFLGIW